MTHFPVNLAGLKGTWEEEHGSIEGEHGEWVPIESEGSARTGAS